MSASSTTGSVRITASAAAIARLAQALFTWDATATHFNVHMSQMTNGQDQAFWEANDVLNAIAKGVDESYQTWWSLERDFDERNIRAFIKLAIANAVVV